MSIAVLLEAAEFLERRERGTKLNLFAFSTGREFFSLLFIFFLASKNCFPLKCRAGENRIKEKEMKIKQIWRFFQVYTKLFSTHQLFCKSVWTRYERLEEAAEIEQEEELKRIAQFFIEIRFN